MERKRESVLIKKKLMVPHAKMEVAAFMEEMLLFLSKPMVKLCEKENAQQVAAPDNWSKTKLQGNTTVVHLAHSVL